MRRLLVAAAIAAMVPAGAIAHESRPGYLELREVAADAWEVLWKVPGRGGMRLGMEVRLPAACETTRPATRRAAGDAWVDAWSVSCPGGLVGSRLSIDGLEETLTDVLVRVQPIDAPALTLRMTPESPEGTIPGAASAREVARTYLLLGVEHILGGADHLLFILALLMIVRGWRRMLATVTAFTVAHSLTLALAVLGVVHVPPAPVEATIALSILFLATEIVHGRQGRAGLTERYPWLVAFTFGLLHGFGFAGALAEVGLPERAIPLALFLFNVGVEIGQVLFVAAVLLFVAAARRLTLSWPAWSWRVPTYAIGTVAAFWTVERVAAFW